MNRLLEIWCSEGFPMNCASGDFAEGISPLRKQLNKIHEAFTGYDDEFEESDDDLFVDFGEDYEDVINVDDVLDTHPKDNFSRVIKDYDDDERSYTTKDRFYSDAIEPRI